MRLALSTLALLLALPAASAAVLPGGGHHGGGGGHHGGGWGGGGHHGGGWGGGGHHGGGWNGGGGHGWGGGGHHGGGWGGGGWGQDDDDCLPGEWEDPFGDWDLPENDDCGPGGWGGGHHGGGWGGGHHGGGWGGGHHGGGWGGCDPHDDEDPEGCAPEYWRDHPERWDNVGTDDFTIRVKHQAAFNLFFDVTSEQSGMSDSETLLDALYLGGGTLNELNRQAAAAAANADAPIDFDLTLNEVIATYRDGVGAEQGSLSKKKAKKKLKKQNEKGCPLGPEDPDITPYCFGDEGDCPCDEFVGGGCPNVTGQGALLEGSGSTSVMLDELVLTTTQLPANTFAITFMGPGPGNEPFGNGRLCASPEGAKLFRFLPAQNSGPDGVIELGTGIVDMSQVNAFAGGQITVGSTWYFQTYYRDIGNTCGEGFNLSNAVRVDFLP